MTRPSPGGDLVRLRRFGPAQQGHDVGRRAELARRDADRYRGVVERQQRSEAVVEDLQPAVAIEGGDAHADMVERVAQDLVVVADRLGRLVDQGARAARQQPAAPAERGDDDAGRGRTQGARQHALGARQRHLDRQPLAGQGPHGALRADEARQQLAQLVDARGVGRRLALRLLGFGAQHEGVGLLGVRAAGAHQQRHADQQQRIDQDADDEALPHGIELGERRRQVGFQRRHLAAARGLAQGRQQQRVEPDDEAAGQARHHAVAMGAPPVEAEHQRRARSWRRRRS